MLAALLHALGRDRPELLLAIELGPLGFTNLAGARQRENEQAQSQAGGGIAIVRLERMQERGKFLDRQGGLLARLARLQLMVQFARGIHLSVAECNSTRKYRSHPLQHARSSFTGSPVFDLLDQLHDLAWLDLIDRTRPKGWQDIGLESAPDLRRMFTRPSWRLASMPLVGYGKQSRR